MGATEIEWCDLTINPITGCLNACDFCYARRFAYRLAGRYGYPADDPFAPTFHPDKLLNIYHLKGTGKRIFLDSMGDWFSPGVDPAWISQVVKAVSSQPDHRFLILTKRPDRISLKKFPANMWFGVSVTRQDDVHRIQELKDALPKCHKFISFEPLHGPIDADLADVGWIIIGAETGNRKGKIKPDPEWIETLRKQAERLGIPIFFKNNLRPYCSPGGHPQQFPLMMESR